MTIDHKDQAVDTSRRAYLKTGAALAGGGLLTVAGCGGGDGIEVTPEKAILQNGTHEAPTIEETGVLEKRLAETDALTPPRAAFYTPGYQSNGYAYHCEMVRRTNVFCIISTSVKNAAGRLLIGSPLSRMLRTDTQMRVSIWDVPYFATLDSGSLGHPNSLDSEFRNPSGYRDLLRNIGIQVIITDTLNFYDVNVPSNNRLIQVGLPWEQEINAQSAYRVLDLPYSIDFPGDIDQEWLFSSEGIASKSNWDVSFRISRIKLPTTRSIYWYSNPMLGQSYVDVDTNPGKTYTYSSTGAAGGSRHLQTSPNDDMVLIPHHSGIGALMMKPLIHPHPNVEARTYATHVARRHINDYGTYIASSNNSEEIKLDELRKEAYYSLFGKSFVQGVDMAITKARAAAMAGETRFSDLDLFGSISDAVESLDNEQTYSYLERNLQKAYKTQPKSTYGAKVGLSLQARFGQEVVILEVPFNLGARISFLISQASFEDVVQPDGTHSIVKNSYRLLFAQPTKRRRVIGTYYTPNDGYKLSYVGIVQPLKLRSETGFLAADIELTFNTSINVNEQGKWHSRLDSVIVDPLIDINLRTWLGGMLEKQVAKILTKFSAAGAAMTLEALPSFSIPTPQTWTAITTAAGDLSGSLVSYTAGFIIQQVTEFLKKTGRTWTLGEVSLLRFGFFNKDALDTTKGFYREWKGGVQVSGVFGAKAFLGTGFEATTGASVGFARVFVAGEIYAPWGFGTNTTGFNTLQGS